METPKPLPAIPPAKDLAIRAAAGRSLGPYPLAPYGADALDPSSAEKGILDYWRLIYRHKVPIIISAIAGLVAGFVIGIPMTPVYRARTSLEVLNLNEDFMNMKRNNPVSTADPSYDVSEAETQTKLLQSDALLNRVIDKLDPASKVAPAPPKMATSGWRSWMHLPEPVQISERQKQLQQIANSLKVRATAHTRVIEALVESTNPKLAAEFANTLVQEFIQQNLEARFAATHGTGDWLTREIGEARANLKKSEDQLQAYARSSGLLFTDENNLATEKLQQLQQQLSGAIAERITRQARFELATKSPPASVADVLADPGLKDTAAKINDLKRQIAELSTIYNPEFSKIKQAQAELAVLQSIFDHNRADILKRIENDYEEAVNREKLLAAAYDAQTREVTGQDEKAIQYNILKREVDSNRKLYDTMLQQTKESSIASALRASNVRVVDPAYEPTVPFSPNFRLNSILGFIAGLILSISLITIREQADRTLQQPGDVKLWTELAELGTIPAASSAIGRIYGRAPVALPGGKNGGKGELVPSPRDPAWSVELTMSQQKFSFVAEAFRSSLSSILFIEKDGNTPQVLVFTSAHPSDGKTTIVSNIAIATAEIKRKVLVIDADLRRPRIQQIFDVPSERGLTNLLSEELNDSSLAGLIHETKVPNLHVLPAGPPTHAAAHLLHSRNFGVLLAKFRQQYDMILIDTPPMLEMTDARVVGRLADAAILVARAGKTTRDSILAAKERLAEDSIRVLGTILNDWDPKKASGGYYGHYGYRQYAKYKANYVDSVEVG